MSWAKLTKIGGSADGKVNKKRVARTGNPESLEIILFSTR